MNTTTFKKIVFDYYKKRGRHDLPWRKHAHLKPYNILVSELMLQQTQVERVVPKYLAFIKRWGGVQALANAPLSEVLKAWQGLGYNRRAKHLHEAAKAVVNEHRGKFPVTYEGLLELPGVGPYTAGAIMAFAYNQAMPLLETNVRSVYLHHFFNDKTDVTDKELLTVVEHTLDTKHPREWYWALMDYGSHLKRTVGNNISQSKHYKKQSKFAGSDRQIRGAILRVLTDGSQTRQQLHRLPFEELRIDAQLEHLLEENMLEKQGRIYQLPN